MKATPQHYQTIHPNPSRPKKPQKPEFGSQPLLQQKSQKIHVSKILA